MKKRLSALRLIGIAALFTATAQAQVAQPGRAGWQVDTRASCKVWNPIPQAGETVEWSGTCTNGYADGAGQLTWRFASGTEVWTVNMAAGKSGTGPYKIVTTHNGTTSTWTGTFTNGMKTGVNVRTFADGNQFEGSWVNGQANGSSVYTTKDGQRQGVFAANGCIWSAETGGTFINSVDKNKNQCLSERTTSPVAANAGSAVTECHTLAASPADPQRKAQGVPYAKINAPKAIAACRLATLQAGGDGQLWFEYGRALERANLLPDAVSAYQTGVNLNNAGAMNNLGELYLDGKGVQKNHATAESLLERSAALGFPEASENLARLSGSVNTSSQSLTPQPNTKNVIDYVLEKRWSIGQFDCNLNGGAYRIFSRNDGLVAVTNGVRGKGPGPNNFQYFSLSSDTFQYVTATLVGENPYMASMGLNPQTPTAVSTFIVRLVNNNRIEHRLTQKIIDIAALSHQNSLQYTTTTENGSGTLCN